MLMSQKIFQVKFLREISCGALLFTASLMFLFLYLYILLSHHTRHMSFKLFCVHFQVQP